MRGGRGVPSKPSGLIRGCLVDSRRSAHFLLLQPYGASPQEHPKPHQRSAGESHKPAEIDSISRWKSPSAPSAQTSSPVIPERAAALGHFSGCAALQQSEQGDQRADSGQRMWAQRKGTYSETCIIAVYVGQYVMVSSEQVMAFGRHRERKGRGGGPVDTLRNGSRARVPRDGRHVMGVPRSPQVFGLNPQRVPRDGRHVMGLPRSPQAFGLNPHESHNAACRRCLGLSCRTLPCTKTNRTRT